MKSALISIIIMSVTTLSAADVKVNFSRDTGIIRPALHSSGFAPKSVSSRNIAEQIKAMNFDYVRTHDLALINDGQRVVDTHFIFPLEHLDASDPKNYYFEATDYLLQLSRDIDLKIFYRLGTSIEHSGLVHFNAEIPSDFDKMAEVFAGTVRHYNRGWADGHNWGIKYWEIWNEPDGYNNMWSFNGEDDRADNCANQPRRMKLYREFFVKVLKRLKSEFPEIKVGGPALCTYKEKLLRPLLQDCKDAGVAPDFISWHYYGQDPENIISAGDKGRKLCDSFGFTETELIINEWHYLIQGGFAALGYSDPDTLKQVLESPAGQNKIDSACFTLTTLARLQTSEYDQSYFYGCRHIGNFGYMDVYRRLNKNYYACKAFGEIVKEYPRMCFASSDSKTVTVLAARSIDGKRRRLLIIDYMGKDDKITVEMCNTGKGWKASATLLSQEKDLETVPVSFADGKLELKKDRRGSAAFVVNLTKQP
ncbi:MAG: hypothetical protein R6V06_06585 [Kiritimatiellia bacterium]